MLTDNENTRLLSVQEHLRLLSIEVDLGDQLILGHKCKTIYVARDLKTGDRLVIKIGLRLESQNEIALNILGYQELSEIGASTILPSRVDHVVVDNIPVLILAHCGDDFWHATKKVENPIQLYRYLTKHVDGLYWSTLRNSDQPSMVVENLVKLIEKVYFERLTEYTDGNLKLKLQRQMLRFPTVKKVCFSSYDFTPEDVFVTETSVKYADPKPGQLGLPIVDLACFAGVSRDAHLLPGSIAGYKLLQDYALNELPKILDLARTEAQLFFALGKVVQVGLSGYHRLVEDPMRAQAFINQGVAELEQICS